MIIELALVVKDIKLKKENLFVLLVTAGTAMWNMGVAYLTGLLLYYGLQRRRVKVQGKGAYRIRLPALMTMGTMSSFPSGMERSVLEPMSMMNFERTI